MKAKEYAEKYKVDPTDQTIGKIAIEMLLEVKIIAESRHAQTSESLISILKEQINKWRAFAKIVEHIGENKVREDGLKRLIIKDFSFIPIEDLVD